MSFMIKCWIRQLTSFAPFQKCFQVAFPDPPQAANLHPYEFATP